MAGLGARLFPAFSKLTAAQVNGYLMDQSIMRFASAAVRDAAFGGAGEPTLAEGMTCYLDDTNEIQSYTGSAWVGVAASSTVANVSSGLVYVAGQAIVAGTNTISDCFTTTYDEYLLVLSNVKTAGNNSGLFLALNGNPTIKTNGYYIGMASSTIFADPSSTTAGFICGFSHTTGASYHVRISHPRTTAQTTFASSWATPSFVGTFTGIEETGVAYTGAVITGGSAITAGGTITVYGYRK
jgi:hypothetical protein